MDRIHHRVAEAGENRVDGGGAPSLPAWLV